MSHPLLSVVLVAMTAVSQAASASTCDTLPLGPAGIPPQLPELPNQFEMHIEANIKNKNITHEVIEYYDYPKNRGAVYFMTKGNRSMLIYNYGRGTVYNISEADGSCIVQNINDTFRIFDIEEQGSSHVSSVADVFKFGKKYNETYMGQTTVRGIPVNRWRSCLSLSYMKATFILNYYFTVESYETASGWKQIPVMLDVTGTGDNVDINGQPLKGTHDFSHVYSFTSFKHGPIKDNEKVFEVPHHIACIDLNATEPYPTIPDQFSLGAEFVLPSRHYSFSVTEYYDFKAKTFRMDMNSRDIVPSKQMGACATVHSKSRIITYIDDFSTGLQYMIDTEEGNCTVCPMPTNAMTADPDDPTHVKMNHISQWLRRHGNGSKFTYEGKARHKGYMLDVWVEKNGENVTKMLFHNLTEHDNQTGGGQSDHDHDDDVHPPHARYVMMGIASKTVLKVGEYESMVFIYNFHEGHPDMGVFDIGTCYKNKMEKKHFKFMVMGHYDRILYGHRKEFYTGVRNAIANSANISALRVSDLNAYIADDGYQIDVQFSILEQPSIQGDASQPIVDSDLQTAVSKLTLDVNNKQLKIDVQFFDPPELVTYPVLPESFSHYVPRPPSATSSGYSAGAMAGLGISMTVIGSLLGLLAAFVIYKRVSMDQVPYAVTK